MELHVVFLLCDDVQRSLEIHLRYGQAMLKPKVVLLIFVATSYMGFAYFFDSGSI